MKSQRNALKHSSVQVAHVIGRSVKSLIIKGGSFGTGSLSVGWTINCI